jgi:DNA-binding response OmpR family regulator
VEGNNLCTILMVDDDDDDFFLVKSAFEEIQLPFEYQLGYLPNGQDLMDYLQRDAKYSDSALSPRPGLILLDLNMPRKDGREALREIKADPELKEIPIVILTTSSEEDDKVLTRNLGAMSFITKPSSFGELVGILKAHCGEWFR